MPGFLPGSGRRFRWGAVSLNFRLHLSVPVRTDLSKTQVADADARYYPDFAAAARELEKRANVENRADKWCGPRNGPDAWIDSSLPATTRMK
jgi:hypothetical protein